MTPRPGASAWRPAPPSGWPGTDWIEDFVLRQSGPDVYDAWVAGEQPWTSPEIRSAFEAFGEVDRELVRRLRHAMNTNFGSAGDPMFDDEPGCLFHHQAIVHHRVLPERGGRVHGRTTTSSGCPTSTRPSPAP